MKIVLNKRIKYIITILTLLFIINIVMSFAYIRGSVVDNESQSTVALSGGKVYVKYVGNSPDIIVNDIIPGFETTKKFTVTSEYGSNHDYYKESIWYTIALAVDNNEFDDGSIICSVDADNASDNDGILAKSSDISIPSGENQNGINLASGRFDNNGMNHVYNLKISYPESGTNQSHMVNSIFQAHVILKDSKYVNLSFNLDGGIFTSFNHNENSSIKVPANSTINLPIPNKEGYIFGGWEVVSGNGSVDNTIITTGNSDISIKALWDDNIPYEFAYTGGEQQFIAELPGYYKIETWGAQGGSASSTYFGGYGGYSAGNVFLNKNDLLYINIGGKGDAVANGPSSGGYNGGGGALSRSSSYIMGSGGGATHIATVSGLLNSIGYSNILNVIIVSGGGGGAGRGANKGSIGGSGGGKTGVVPSNACKDCGTRTGGGQTLGGTGRFGTGSFGQGAGSTSTYSCGGGGGLYGGAGDTHQWGASGGSGYIGNSLLASKVMYCYNCTTSDVESTKTYSTTCAEATPTENCAKKGNGYARITYLHS